MPLYWYMRVAPSRKRGFEALREFKDDPNCFITFTSLEKVGVNPSTPYSTPVGVYAYKLHDVWNELEDNNYMFGIERPFVSVLRLATANVLNIGTLPDKEPYVSRMKQFYATNGGKDFQTLVSDFEACKTPVYQNDLPGKFVYNLGNYMCKRLSGEERGTVKRSMVLFNKLLRETGFEAVVDQTSTIHLLQPSQAVFLTPASYKVEGTVPNAAYDPNKQAPGDTYWYEGANPTVDNVIFRKNGTEFEVLLIERRGKVEHGKWAFPGGFIDTAGKKGEMWVAGRENPLQAAIRELHEETNLYASLIAERIQAVGVFEGHGRDPRDNDRAWSKSHAFTLVLPDNVDISQICARDDAAKVGWFKLSAVPPLAFDHAKILTKASDLLAISSPVVPPIELV